ncbi:MAG: hypothetical protein HQ592_08595 [Planctomycetes bacterium]|nr:hypothetical protein [Planctomycetota bacterium]
MMHPGEVFDTFLRGPDDLPASGAVAHVASERTIDVCGREERVTLRREDLSKYYLPLALTLIRMQAADPSRRLLAGVAGCPGAGKSIFALLLAEVVNALPQSGGGACAAVVPLDGFHHTNAYLESHFVPGTDTTLRKIKGRPDTFDVEAAIRAFTQLRSLSDELSLPGYSRQFHEPVDHEIRIGKEDSIVIVEGNSLCMTKKGPWAQLSAMLDVKIFLDADREQCRDRLIRRHVRGGRSPEDAARHYEMVDLPNAVLIEKTMNAADILVKNDFGRIRGVGSRFPNMCNENDK